MVLILKYEVDVRVYGFEWWLNYELIKVDAVIWNIDYVILIIYYAFMDVFSMQTYVYGCVYVHIIYILFTSVS